MLLGIQLYDTLNVKNSNIDAHRGIGIFILVLSILQILTFVYDPEKIRRFKGTGIGTITGLAGLHFSLEL
ncbi:hypothetical protein QYF36_025726 [Acer negundo]|nr:hypothetical protein QYF36_025726 [Acer negundo]